MELESLFTNFNFRPFELEKLPIFFEQEGRTCYSLGTFLLVSFRASTIPRFISFFWRSRHRGLRVSAIRERGERSNPRG